MSFDRAKVRVLRDKLQAALDEFGKQNGYAITILPSIRFGVTATVKLDVKERGEGDQGESGEKIDWMRFCAAYGLAPEDYQREIEVNGTRMRLVGIQPSRPKYPISARHARTGTGYKLTVAQVKMGLGRKPEFQMPEIVPAPTPRGHGRSEGEILADLRRVENELSPENLSADGELPISQIRARRAKLNRERAALVSELGREPTDQELYQF